MSKKEKKLVDIGKHIRRISYKVQNFFKYRVMVNSKHMIIVGGHNNPLTPIIYSAFQSNWRIAHIGQEDTQAQLYLDPADDLQSLMTKAKQFSSHFEAIIVLEDFHSLEGLDILQEHALHKKSITQALQAVHLATKILTGNGFLCFTVDEQSYFEKPNEERTLGQLVRDCQLQHLAVNLGDREDLETDTLVLALLTNNEQIYSSFRHKEIVKYIKMWSDGIKRPSSGTFVQFKQSEHKNPVIYPELL